MIAEAGAASLTVEHVLLLGAGRPVDVRIEEGVVAEISSSTRQDPPRVLLPGFLDMHTHLREPGNDEAETILTGTQAAAAGGYTDVFAMANTSPVTDSVARVAAVRRRSQESHYATVHPVSAASMGLRGEELVDVASLREAGVLLFSDDGKCVEDEGLVFALLTQLAELGGVFAQHAQSTAIVQGGVINAPVAERAGCTPWPAVGEEAIVARDIAISHATGGRLHICHVSTRRSVELVRFAKSVGAPVTAEVTPHHLVLMDEDALAAGPALKVNPPLRSHDDVLALRDALRDGTIDVVATDHAPHPVHRKKLPWSDAAFGLTALETALPIVAEVLTGPRGVDWERITQVMAFVPRRILGEGVTDFGGWSAGDRANFTVVSDTIESRIAASRMLSRSTNTPFDGRSTRFRVELTLHRGRVSFETLR